MFCNIKYSPFLVNSIHSLNRIGSLNDRTESLGRRKPRLRNEDPYPPKLLEGNEMCAGGGTLTNQLVYEMAMNLIKQKRLTIDSMEADKVQFDINHMVPQVISGSNNSKYFERTQKSIVKISLSEGPRARKSQKIKLKGPEHKNETIMINPDCNARILMDYIYNTLDIEKQLASIDLCDDNGTMMRMFELKSQDNAKCRLENRNTYNLVIVEWDFVNCEYIAATPLISGNTPTEIDIIYKVNHCVPKRSDSSIASGKRSARETPKHKLQKKLQVSNVNIATFM